MADLILRPSVFDTRKPWALQLRYHDSVGPTTYQTLAYVEESTAREIVGAGEAFWLFGDPANSIKQQELVL